MKIFIIDVKMWNVNIDVRMWEINIDVIMWNVNAFFPNKSSLQEFTMR